jgi:hypothetical protein
VYHRRLLELGNNLGYPGKGLGFCHSFAIRWLEAVFLKQEQLFKDRFKLIVDTPKEILLGKIKNAPPYDRELLDILAFYDSLSLFHRPEDFPFLFGNKYLSQHELEIISKIASSDNILEKGGLTGVYSECLLFSEGEISSYLDDLEQRLKSVKGEKPIGFLLSNKTHVVAMVYQPGEGWYYRNINQDSLSSEHYSSSGIANSIIKGFSDDPSNPQSYSAFNIMLVLTRNDARINTLKESLQIFKKTHSITQETASRQTDENLVYIASMMGDVDLLKTLVVYGFDLNKKVNGITPAYIAAQNGHTEAL